MPNYGDEVCSNSIQWGRSFEYPMPVIVRNTFFEVVARQPESFDEFIIERKVQSSPPTVQTKPEEEKESLGPTANCTTNIATPSSSSTATPEQSYASLSSIAAPCAPCVRLAPMMPPYASDYTGFVPNSSLPYPSSDSLEYYAASNMGLYARSSPSSPPIRRATTACLTTSGSSSSAVPSSASTFAQHREAYAPLIPGLVSTSWPTGSEGRRTTGPSVSRGLLLAARADEPAEYADSSSNEDGTQEVEILGGSDTAELGSPLCPTLGSRGHSLRMCKPCAFITKGCQSGVDCKFCHLCEVGEKKRRKKEKVVFRREMNKWRQALTPTAGWKPQGFW